MRKFIRRLLMLHPGYRKAHFVELEVQELRRELVGLLEGNEARVKEVNVAAKPADRTDEVLQAIAAAKPADRTDELLAARVGTSMIMSPMLLEVLKNGF